MISYLDTSYMCIIINYLSISRYFKKYSKNAKKFIIKIELNFIF